MPLARFKQHVGEIKRYTVEYDNWLDTGELLSTAVFEIQNITVPPLVVTLGSIGDTSVTFYVSEGLAGETYEVLLTVTTTGGQTRIDELKYILDEL